MPAADAAVLKPQVQELRAILDMARNGSSAARFSVFAASFSQDPRNSNGTMAQALAARDSSSVTRVFDNNRFSASFAPPVQASAQPSGTRTATLSAPASRKKDIQLQVPSPVSSTQAKPASVPAQALASAPVKVERVSKHVLRITDASGKTGFEVGVADLLRQMDPAARAALSRQIASEIFAALGKKDERLLEALADFLRDIAEYAPSGAKSVRLSVDGQGRYSLVFERADGSRRILTGQFLPASGPDGKPSGTGFIVMRPIETGPDGAVRSQDMGYWREYLAGGRRQEWSATSETEQKGWGPWAHENQLQKVWLAQQSWTGKVWQQTRKDNAKTLTLKEGKSWFGNAGDTVMKTPVVGPSLKFCDDVGATLFTGIAAAPQVLISAVADSDTYSIEAAGSYAHNPLMRALVEPQGFLDRLTPGARKELMAQVRFNRLQALQSAPFPLPPDLMKQVVEAPISAKDAFETLKSDYGMGSYGKRLVQSGAQEEGWKSHALKTAGVATGVFENVGEAVFNPIMWAMLGTGHAATAVKGTQSFVAGAAGAKATYTAVTAVNAVATAAWWGPWLISATDNVGHLVRLTKDGKFDKDYYKNVEDVAGDLIYLFLIP
jgi:hypothetical protein